MDAIKMLWEKIDRESEWTWRYEVFRDNIEKYLPKEEVEVTHHYNKVDNTYEMKVDWESVRKCKLESEPNKILPLNKLKW